MLASIRHAVMPHSATYLRRTAVVAVLGLSVLAVHVGLAPSAQARNNEAITLCHATGASGWNAITVDKSAIDWSNGHAHHDGDIIPSFEAVDGIPAFAGLNLDTTFVGSVTGAQILAAGCSLPERPARPEPVVATVVTEGTPDCVAGEVEVTTTTTTTGWVWDESGFAWVAGEPSVERVTSTRAATVTECPVRPARPEPVVATVVTEGTPDCVAGEVEVTTTTTTTGWVWDESGFAWVAGEPSVERVTSTRAATVTECAAEGPNPSGQPADPTTPSGSPSPEGESAGAAAQSVATSAAQRVNRVPAARTDGGDLGSTPRPPVGFPPSLGWAVFAGVGGLFVMARRWTRDDG
jgi:hypothetical protein